jgi:hypothetical protein
LFRIDRISRTFSFFCLGKIGPGESREFRGIPGKLSEKLLSPPSISRLILSSILSSFLTIFYKFRTSLTATEARIGLRVKETVNESAPRSVRRKRSNTTPSETQSLPSRRKRRSLPLNSVKQRKSEWHEERGERKYSLMKSYKLIIFGDMTSTLFFSLFLLLYVI